ncbi:hypothetical protein [Campylobacter concisus]|uniref:hypothetical protein n=1 Tax=Campylobacter concisus TaxID=199 RepID=UPI00131C7661|nr:hypothetical protein [Campylobacter concisus]
MQLRDKVEVKPYDVRGGVLQCFALHAVYYKASVRQILKFMNKHITALNLVASGYET